MRKLTQIVGAVAIALILPAAALAHGALGRGVNAQTGVNAGINNTKADVKAQANSDASVNGLFRADDDKNKDSNKKDEDNNKNHQKNQRALSGTVTAVSSTGFTLSTADGKTYTVVATDANITLAFGAKIQLSDIKVKDRVLVKGSADGSLVVAARTVMVVPANTHPAIAKGTVTAVSGNTITVETTHLGIPNTVTVKTSGDTVFKQNGATTTQASIQAGSQVKVKGLWDEILKVLNAIKVKIKL